jgi:hypothetical protein
MWVRVSLAGVCLAGLLSACAIIDPVDSRYDTVGRSLAKARDEAIFLNLVRANHDYPLSFTTVSNVTPSLTNVSQFGLPTFIEGPLFKGATPIAPPYKDFLFTNNSASNSTSVSTNFSVSTQETSAFYEGFLKPIDLTTLDYFIRQGYPREMLFWLFTDYFEVKANGQTLGYRYAPPDDYGCPPEDRRRRCFIDWVRLATLSGLTVEQRTLQKSSSGKSGGGGSDTKSTGASDSAKPSTTAFARFCFSTVLSQQARQATPPGLVNATFAKLGSDAVFDPTQKCGSPAWNPLSTLNKPQPDVFVFQVGATMFKIVPRSAYGVFEFLGKLMKMQRVQPGQGSTPIPPEPIIVPRDQSLIPPERPEVMYLPILPSVHDDPFLITVDRGVGPDCFSHTWFYDGDYCVPQNAATTKRIFGLLAQLIAIQTAAADLSITPIVRIIQ